MPVRSSGHLQEHLQDRHHLVPLWRPTLWHEVRILDLRRQPGTLLSPLNTKHAQSTHKAPKKKKKKNSLYWSRILLVARSIAPFSFDDTNVASKLPPMDDPKATNPNARYIVVERETKFKFLNFCTLLSF